MPLYQYYLTYLRQHSENRPEKFFPIFPDFAPKEGDKRQKVCYNDYKILKVLQFTPSRPAGPETSVKEVYPVYRRWICTVLAALMLFSLGQSAFAAEGMEAPPAAEQADPAPVGEEAPPESEPVLPEEPAEEPSPAEETEETEEPEAAEEPAPTESEEPVTVEEAEPADDEPQTVAAGAPLPTEQEAYQRMIALREKYPDGSLWDGNSYYMDRNGYAEYGCFGFAIMLQEAAFVGRTQFKVRRPPITIDDIYVGDVLSYGISNGQGGHSVIVLERHDDYVVLAEGNWDRSANWGRTMSAEEIKNVQYCYTYYIDDSFDPRPPKLQFTDVPEGSWYRDVIKSAFEQGIVKGVSDTEFDPDGVTTRGQAVTMLYRAMGSPGGTPVFSDTSGEVAVAAGWAAGEGVTTGATPTTFEPNARISRQQLVTMLYRLAGSPDVAKASSLDQFTDAGKVQDYARDAVCWAIGKGLLTGNGDGTLRPEGSATRAEVCALITRYIG